MKYHVLVGTHHRTGTAWMHSVFREISEQLAVPYLHLNRIGVSGRSREGVPLANRHSLDGREGNNRCVVDGGRF